MAPKRKNGNGDINGDEHDDRDEHEYDDSLEASFRLSRDLKRASKTMSEQEARFLVGKYYEWQEQRIRTRHQARAAEQAEEPHDVIKWLFSRSEALEGAVKAALHEYAKSKLVGRWCLSIHGIGPIVTAGLLAHIDIQKAPYVGHIWRFAGLDPTSVWLGREGAIKLVEEVMGTAKAVTPDHLQLLAARGPFKEATLQRFAMTEDGKITKASLQKALARKPWNADLKRLCWIIGGLFVRLAYVFEKDEKGNRVKDADGNDMRGWHPNDIYGKIWAERKARAIAKNEAGGFADLAESTLRTKRIQDPPTLECYRAGKLPPGRIEAGARRVTVKLFLAHLHHVMYEVHYKTPPPMPYILTHSEEHTQFLGPPNWPMVE